MSTSTITLEEILDACHGSMPHEGYLQEAFIRGIRHRLAGGEFTPNFSCPGKSVRETFVRNAWAFGWEEANSILETIHQSKLYVNRRQSRAQARAERRQRAEKKAAELQAIKSLGDFVRWKSVPRDGFNMKLAPLLIGYNKMLSEPMAVEQAVESLTAEGYLVGPKGSDLYIANITRPANKGPHRATPTRLIDGMLMNGDDLRRRQSDRDGALRQIWNDYRADMSALHYRADRRTFKRKHWIDPKPIQDPLTNDW